MCVSLKPIRPLKEEDALGGQGGGERLSEN